MPEPSLSEVSKKYAESLSQSGRTLAVGEVDRFVRWFGRDRLPSQIRGHDIELYGETLGPAVPETSKKTEQVRKFLTYLVAEGFAASPLAPHLRLRKSSKSGGGGGASQPETVELTAEGIEALKGELEALIAQRPAIREAIRLAMLDKDFRENSPLDAAKNKQGHVEARVREIEAMLRRAVVVDGSAGAGRVRVGTTVTVTKLNDGTVKTYSIVGPTEANAADGKISSVSPVGKAFLNCQVGEEVEVEAPKGAQRFRIDVIVA
jgi:transcription elongation factor GreA